MFSYHFPIISCLKYTVNSYFRLFRRKTLLTNDFKLTVSDLYIVTNGLVHTSTCGSGCGSGAVSKYVPTPFCAAAAAAKYFALHFMFLFRCPCHTEWGWNPIDSGTVVFVKSAAQTQKAALILY